MAGNDKHRDQEERPHIIISDKRHSREEEEIPEAPAEERPAAAETKPSTAEPELEVVEPEAAPAVPAADENPAASGTSDAPQAIRREPPEGGPVEEELQQSAEMEQLKLIFGAGITSYLAGQVSMIINFALIYLGRAANPATGLVAVDIKKAKASIDTLEFIANQIRSELPAEEQQQLAGIVADLKYTFMQAATGATEPEPPKGNGS